MEKKLWSNAEVVELGVESTKDCGHTDDCVPGDDKGLLVHKCKYCGKYFWTHCEEVAHEKTCGKNPANPPAAEGEGPFPLPTPGLS